MYKNIPVSPEVHKQVQQIADANFRTLGGQVAYWLAAEKCDHPAKTRQPVELAVSYPETGMAPQKVRGYCCGLCHALVVAGLPCGGEQ